MPQVAGRQRTTTDNSGTTTKLATKRQPIKANLVAATPCGDTKNNKKYIYIISSGKTTTTNANTTTLHANGSNSNNQQ